MSDNLRYWQQVCITPKDCKKPIEAGRLRGKTDISPMWRIEMLTKMFGPCGIGWKVDVVSKEILQGDGTETRCFVHLNLYIKDGESWSAGIPGFGGSSYVTKEKSGVYTDDECYKKAFTDALGSACKLLGFSADIFSSSYGSKYDRPQMAQPTQPLRFQFEPFVGLTPEEAYRKDPRMCYAILNDPNAPEEIKSAIRAAAGKIG